MPISTFAAVRAFIKRAETGLAALFVTRFDEGFGIACFDNAAGERMVKFLIKFLAFLAVIFGIGFLAINALLDPISDRAINFIFKNLHTPSLTLSEPSFKNARISSHNAITWDEFGFTATLAPNTMGKKPLKARVMIEALTVESEDLLNGLFVIDLSGLNITMEYLRAKNSAEGKEAPEIFQDGNLTAPIRLNVLSLDEAASQLRDFAVEIKKFTEEGKTAIPIRFSGEEIITVQDNSYTVSLLVQQKGENYCLVASRDDLKFVSDGVLPQRQTSTAADIEIIANNPIRAPQLLKIRSAASNTAASAHAGDPKVPEDAYRHVLWSYLLTREFGPDFAREVTDAHELKNDPEEKNDPGAEASHRQDYINNEVGRTYAAQRYRESDIPRLVMTDPKVIR
jgi:hypothetical protein